MMTGSDIRPPRRRSSPEGPLAARGLTYVEVLAACGVLLVLATAVVPLYHWHEKRRLEVRLRMSLETMRNAIDKYKEYADQGKIAQKDVEQMGYPESLEELVEGVEMVEVDPDSLEARRIVLLREIPVDPFTGEPEWGLRSYQDDWDSTNWGGENVWDVYSLSDLVALDGTYYRDW